MFRLFNTLLGVVKAKMMALWTKIRLWTSRSYWETKGVNTFRQFFSRLLNVKPRSQSDYYPVLRWLVSKRLAFALVIVLGLLSVFYILFFSPVSAMLSASSPSLPSFRYNALPLKFYSGNVQITAADGHVAYEGTVGGGVAQGQGVLYRADGSVVYSGAFEDSKYNGSGSLFYQDGVLRYEGGFEDNLFSGQGSLYRQSGVLEYQGGFLRGLKSGAGTLYNSGGNAIFAGNFLSDRPLFSELLGKTTAEAASMYTGDTTVYNASGENSVSLDEIGVVYTANDGSNSLDAEWTIGEIVVEESSFPTTDALLTGINELTAYFGEPVYFGYTWPTLSEAVAIRRLSEAGSGGFPDIEMEMTAGFDDVYSVTSYDKNYELYIYVYQADGLLYTFYCDSSTSDFSFYSVSLSGEESSAQAADSASSAASQEGGEE